MNAEIMPNEKQLMKKELRREKGQGHIGHLNRRQDGKAKGICRRRKDLKRKNKFRLLQSIDVKGVIDSLSVLIQTNLRRVNSCLTGSSKFTKNVGCRFTSFWYYINIAFGIT